MFFQNTREFTEATAGNTPAPAGRQLFAGRPLAGPVHQFRKIHFSVAFLEGCVPRGALRGSQRGCIELVQHMSEPFIQLAVHIESIITFGKKPMSSNSIEIAFFGQTAVQAEQPVQEALGSIPFNFIDYPSLLPFHRCRQSTTEPLSKIQIKVVSKNCGLLPTTPALSRSKMTSGCIK